MDCSSKENTFSNEKCLRICEAYKKLANGHDIDDREYHDKI